MKQHLAGTGGNVRPCLKVSDDLGAEMLGLPKNQKTRGCKER